jgi:hypothetical protein
VTTYALAALAVLLQSLMFLVAYCYHLRLAAGERAQQNVYMASLLQRIQAPQDAVYTHSLAASDAAPPAQPLVMGLPFDDDEAFHETKEQLAERLVD